MTINGAALLAQPAPWHPKGDFEMRDATYKIVTVDSDGTTFVSDETLDSEAMVEHMAVAQLLHAMGGWETERCGCGLGRVFRKGGLVRVVHPMREEDEEGADLETLALAVGVLQPASLDGRLEVTV